MQQLFHHLAGLRAAEPSGIHARPGSWGRAQDERGRPAEASTVIFRQWWLFCESANGLTLPNTARASSAG